MKKSSFEKISFAVALTVGTFAYDGAIAQAENLKFLFGDGLSIQKEGWAHRWKFQPNRTMLRSGKPFFDVRSHVPKIVESLPLDALLDKISIESDGRFEFEVKSNEPMVMISIRRTITYEEFFDRIVLLYEERKRNMVITQREDGNGFSMIEQGYKEPKRKMAKKSSYPVIVTPKLNVKQAPAVTDTAIERRIESKDQKTKAFKERLDKVEDETMVVTHRGLFGLGGKKEKKSEVLNVDAKKTPVEPVRFRGKTVANAKSASLGFRVVKSEPVVAEVNNTSAPVIDVDVIGSDGQVLSSQRSESSSEPQHVRNSEKMVLASESLMSKIPEPSVDNRSAVVQVNTQDVQNHAQPSDAARSRDDHERAQTRMNEAVTAVSDMGHVDYSVDRTEVDNVIDENTENVKFKILKPSTWGGRRKKVYTPQAGEGELVVKQSEEIRRLKEKLSEYEQDESQVHQIDEIRDGAFDQYRRKKARENLLYENRLFKELKSVDQKLTKRDISMEYLAGRAARNSAEIDALKKEDKTMRHAVKVIDPFIEAEYLGKNDGFIKYNLKFNIKGELFNQTLFRTFMVMPYDHEGKELLPMAIEPEEFKPIRIDGVEKNVETNFSFNLDIVVSRFGIALVGTDIYGMDAQVEGHVKVLFNEDFNAAKMNKIGKWYDEVEIHPHYASLAYYEAVRMNPNHPSLRYNLGQTFLKRRKYVKAISAFQAGLRLDRDDMSMKHALGVAMKRLGEQYIRESQLGEDPFTMGLLPMDNMRHAQHSPRGVQQHKAQKFILNSH
jgi:tetratricopeptide (TPR) repeat protein